MHRYHWDQHQKPVTCGWQRPVDLPVAALGWSDTEAFDAIGILVYQEFGSRVTAYKSDTNLLSHHLYLFAACCQ